MNDARNGLARTGIAPTQPGYAEFQVLPELGDLTEVAASVPSKTGAISINIRRGPPFTMQLTVPSATRATAGIPIDMVTSQGSARIEITLDGTVVFTAGNATSAGSASFAGEASGYVKFVLLPGAHTVSARQI